MLNTRCLCGEFSHTIFPDCKWEKFAPLVFSGWNNKLTEDDNTAGGWSSIFVTGIKFNDSFHTRRMAKPLPTDPFWSVTTGARQLTTVSRRFVFPSYNLFIVPSHGRTFRTATSEKTTLMLVTAKKTKKSHEIIVIASSVAQPVCYPYAVFHGIRYNYETNI